MDTQKVEGGPLKIFNISGQGGGKYCNLKVVETLNLNKIFGETNKISPNSIFLFFKN
jgi:hypothetical protein